MERKNYTRKRLPLPTFDDPAELAWLAGLLEGEGCFTRTGNGAPAVDGSKKYRVAVSVGGNDRDVIEHAARLMKSSARRIEPTPGSRATDYWTVSISGPRAEAVMLAVLPFMGERRSARIAQLLADHPSSLRRAA